MGRKYVLDGAIVKCSMGMAPAKLMVVTNQRVKIQGKFKATHMDRLVPQTFIQCKLKPTPGGFLPCTPMLLPWQKTAQKTNLRGILKFLYDDSYSMCGFGGKVTVVHPMQINAAGAAFEQYTNISTTIPGAMPLAGFDEGTLPESESNSFLDSFQTVLDIAGLVPGFGEIADGINAAIYVARGDYANAALSAAAMIPIGGQAATAAKLGMKASKKGAERVTDMISLAAPTGKGGKTSKSTAAAATRGADKAKLDAFNDGVKGLVDKSPTLTKKLKSLEDNGWSMKYGAKGKGTYVIKKEKKIVIDSNYKSDDALVVQSLAHEAGHATYKEKPYVSHVGKTREQYVKENTKRHLDDEGEATLVNVEVRNEIMGNKGADIGIAGAKAKEYQKAFRNYKKHNNRGKAREEIGNIFAKGETPSTDRTKNYEQYYSATYENHWDTHIKPKKP